MVTLALRSLNDFIESMDLSNMLYRAVSPRKNARIAPGNSSSHDQFRCTIECIGLMAQCRSIPLRVNGIQIEEAELRFIQRVGFSGDRRSAKTCRWTAGVSLAIVRVPRKQVCSWRSGERGCCLKSLFFSPSK
jgi:hypothetical protein